MEENTTAAIVRPTFLTVLCILTFIGSGLGIIGALISYSTADAAIVNLAESEEALDEARDEIDSEEGTFANILKKVIDMSQEKMENITVEQIHQTAITSVFSSLLTLFGALFMWGLNIRGYFIYITGILILIIGNTIISSISDGLLAGFWGILFIILYGLNLKHMH